MSETEAPSKYAVMPPKPTPEEMKACSDAANDLDEFLRQRTGPLKLHFAFFTSLIFSGVMMATIAKQTGIEPAALAKTYAELLVDWMKDRTATVDDAAASESDTPESDKLQNDDGGE